MKYRANHQQNQHNLELHTIYLDNLLELEKEQQKLEQQRVKSTNNSTVSSLTNATSMKHKQLSNSAQISGLNNLGNSCFFNAILQNLAQTPHLEELLREYSNSQEKQFVLKHNDDYDSELTDFDEDETTPNGKKDTPKPDHSEESSNEIELISAKNDNENKTNGKVHRSMRLNDLTILLKEQSGATPNNSFLGKQLADLLKNMNNSAGTVNPSVLFGSVCKKIPAFKGFHQQDSHELLRNLLDAIKTEELKRRQAALLETFRVSKPNSLDEKLKMKIKRYGRLASYTHIDKLFGGHLLSSIVCEECNTCIQRVEPFLDLSLPISLGLQTMQATATVDELSDDNSKRRVTRSSKKSLKNTTNPTTNEQQETKQPVSKHLNKKQQKKAAKNAKKQRKQAKDKESLEEEAKDDSKETTQATTNEVSEKDLAQAVNKLNLDDENQNITTNVNTLKEDSDSNDEESELNSNPTNTNTTTITNNNHTENNKAENDLNDLDEEDNKSQDEFNFDESKYKLENSFKLEAMKTIKQYQLQQQQETEPATTTLQSCLARFTSNEILSDKLKCDNCTKKNHKINTYTKAIKQYLICELPGVLTIHLKRFQQHGYRLEKSNKHVQFPLILDMSSYTSKMCINLNREQRNQSESVLYSLYGLVEHSGRLNSGHYTAYVKSNRNNRRLKSNLFMGNQRLCHLNMMLKKWNGQAIVDTNNNSLDNKRDDLNEGDNESNGKSESASASEQSEATDSNSTDDQWFYISDSHVTEVNVSKVLKAQAYILFYERIN